MYERRPGDIVTGGEYYRPGRDMQKRLGSGMIGHEIRLAPLLFVFIGCLSIAVADPVDGLAEVNLTPQDIRIATWGDSWIRWGVGYLEEILGCEVSHYYVGGIDQALEDMVRFEDPGNRFDIIITNLGCGDDAGGASWESIESGLRRVFRYLKSTGAVVVYNQVVPKSSYSKLVVEEGVVLVANISDGIMLDFEEGKGPVFHCYFDDGGGWHPSDEAYSLMLERTAKVMLDSGLVEWAEDREGICAEASRLLLDASALIEAVEKEGLDAAGFRRSLGMAEYILERDCCYTTSWVLTSQIVDRLQPFVGHYDEIQIMFANVSEEIDRAEGQAIDATRMRADYRQARIQWEGYGYEQTRDLLAKILSDVERVLDCLAEISAMFSSASMVIDDARKHGMDTQEMDRSYSRAEIYWGQYDCERTRRELQKIIPESAIVPALVALSAFVLRRRVSW